MAEEVESGAAVHLAHDSFRAGVDAFGSAVVVREGEAGVHGVAGEFEAVGVTVQVGQVSGSGVGDPGGEFGVVAFGRGEEFGEAADQAGEVGQLGACGRELLQQPGVTITQPVGVGEQETGQAARGDDGPVPSARPWVM